MQLARVIGDVVATRKDENLTGIKLLIVQPLTVDRRRAIQEKVDRAVTTREQRREDAARDRDVPSSDEH